MRTKIEYGSDFHLDLSNNCIGSGVKRTFTEGRYFSLFFSGRGALYHLLRYGIKIYKWENIYFPSYYCHEVVEFINSLPLRINYYSFNPFLDMDELKLDIEDKPQNVIINVFFFGLKKLKLENFHYAEVIEDLTHDILAIPSSNFAFGSLRKQLPLPCGGFVLSKDKKDLSVPPGNLQSDLLSMKRLIAMSLKSEYLRGIFKDKNLFRSLFIESEKGFKEKYTLAGLPILAESFLKQMKVKNILKIKDENLTLALSLLKTKNKAICNMNSNSKAGLGLILQLPSQSERERLKMGLIKENIYPAVLWPGQKNNRDIKLENTILFLHIDYRYNADDIIFIVNLVNRILQKTYN